MVSLFIFIIIISLIYFIGMQTEQLALSQHMVRVLVVHKQFGPIKDIMATILYHLI